VSHYPVNGSRGTMIGNRLQAYYEKVAWLVRERIVVYWGTV